MATPAPVTITATLDHVKVARLHESKMNPRRHFSGIEELTASVSVKKLENQHIAAANAKAAKKQKSAKSQTSAKKKQAKS